MSSGPPGRSPYHHTRSRQSRVSTQRGANHGVSSSTAVPESESLADPPRTTSAAIMNMNMNLTARFDDALDSSQTASFTGHQHQFSNRNTSNTSMYSSGTSSFYNNTFLGQGHNPTLSSSQEYNPFALSYESTQSPNYSNNSRMGYPPIITASHRYSIGSTTSSTSSIPQQQHVHFAPSARKSFLDKSYSVSFHPSSTKSAGTSGTSFSFSNSNIHNHAQPPFSLVDVLSSPSSFLRSQRYSLGSTSTATSAMEESKEHPGPVNQSSTTTRTNRGKKSGNSMDYPEEETDPTTHSISNPLDPKTQSIFSQQQQQRQQQKEEEEKSPMILHLRNLVTSCLQSISTPYTSASSAPFAAFSSSISSPASMTVFYASMLYARTQSLEDAFLYAQALVSNDEKKRAIWILDKAGLLSCPTTTNTTTITPHSSKEDGKATAILRIDSVLLAASCLSSAGEWEEALLLIEEVFRYPQPEQCRLQEDSTLEIDQDKTSEDLFPFQHASETIIESGDDPRILLLANYVQTSTDCISSHSNHKIHPVARLCTLRGIAYDEMSNPTRATSFLIAALKIDPTCVQAWNYLCIRHLLSPMEEKELVSTTLKFDPTWEWLRDIYLARLAIPRIDCLVPWDDTHGDGTVDSFQLGQTKPPHRSLYTTLSPSRSTQGNHALEMMDESTIHLQATPSMILSSKVNTSIFGPNDLQFDKNFHELPDDDAHVDVFHKIQTQHGLFHAPEVLALAAIRAYDSYNLPAALLYCKALSDIDPLCSTAAHVHIATLTGLRHKRPLFRLAHMLVEADPKSAMAWYAVGCYYQLCGKYDLAQKHFCRATRLNPRSAECWIAFGCSFAARDESDQALASFRAAQRLHSGNHYPMLYMGMEYLRTNHLSLAGHFLKNARLMGPDDPLCYHELGVLAYRKSAWNEATGWFLNAIRIYTERIAYTNSETLYDDDVKAPTTKETFGEVAISLSNLECIEHCQDNFWEPTIFNLGHCYRKMKRFPEALLCFEKCASLCPNKASTFSALGYTKHLMGDIDVAIEVYHQALGIKSDDTFTVEMLNRALQESLELSETQFSTTKSDLHDNTSAFETVSNGHVSIKSRYQKTSNRDCSHETDDSCVDMNTD